MTNDAMTLLAAAKPISDSEARALAPASLEQPPRCQPVPARRRRTINKRLAFGAGITGVIIALGIPAVATGAVSDLFVAEAVPMPGEPTDPYLNIQAPEWKQLVDERVAAIPLPPGTNRAQFFSPLHKMFPKPASALSPLGAAEWARKNPELNLIASNYGLNWIETGVPVSEPSAPSPSGSSSGPISEEPAPDAVGVQASTVTGLGTGMAVEAWYHYWLNATPEQKAAVQPVLDQMASWPALQHALSFVGYKGERIGQIAKVAEAARHNDSGPMRRWLEQIAAGTGG